MNTEDVIIQPMLNNSANYHEPTSVYNTKLGFLYIPELHGTLTSSHSIHEFTLKSFNDQKKLSL